MKTILVVLNKTKRQDKIMKLANENNYFREMNAKNTMIKHRIAIINKSNHVKRNKDAHRKDIIFGKETNFRENNCD